MAPIENDGSGDEFYDEYDDILNHIKLAEMLAADRENGLDDGDETDLPKVSVNLNDGELNRPYKFNAHRPYDVKKDKSKVCFKNFRKTFFVPFCFYLDFESYLVKTTDKYDREIHVPSGFCCLRVAKDEYVEYNDEAAYVYSGPDAMQHFYRHMRSELEKIDDILDKQEPMELTVDEQEQFDDATNCHTCGEEFDDDDVIACRHHNHVTGKYLAAVCQICNLQLKPSKLKNKMNNKFFGNQFFVSVICHNMKGYDSHHILKHLSPIFEENPDEFAEIHEIDVIASNTEKYIGFQMGALRFLDSLQFLNASLNTLVSNLSKDGLDNLHHTKRHFKDEELHLVSRKGIFPYSWFDDEAKMTETGLPPREDFFSNLTEEGVSEEDYSHAKTVWEKFGMTTFKEYHDLYSMTDVLLLADVVQQFRGLAKREYDLDPLHYYTAPGFSWDSMLKLTTTCGQGTTSHLDLLLDSDQGLFIEKGIRGGISMISNRVAVANNPEVPDYDASKPTNWLQYLDANNLYGWAMMQPLPERNFRFLSENEVSDFDVNVPRVEDDKGYILEVDLLYPEELHDLHNDYPLAPERLVVTKEMISEYGKHLSEKLGTKFSKIEKLVPNFYDKKKYVLHIRNLQLYISLGMRCTKIHRILEFTQSRWLAPYIEKNTQLRAQATSGFEKDFFKLLNNSVFGKTMVNVRQRQDIRLVTDPTEGLKLASRPTFQSFKIVNENLSVVKLMKTHIIMNKPTYIGMCVLDLSKLLMYDFHYNIIKKRYGSKAKLLFTDTDSLAYSIETPNVYADMQLDIDLYDTSDYPRDHALYSKRNAKVVGKFKDELNGVAALEFIGLRPKMYSLLLPDKKI